MKFNRVLQEGWRGTRGVPDGSGPGPGMAGRGMGATGCNRPDVILAVRDLAASKGVSDYELDRIVSQAIADSSSTEEAIKKAKSLISKKKLNKN